MGLSPREVDGMSLWEFNACFHGWQAAHDPEGRHGGPGAMTPERAAELGIKGF